ncbi:eukaryotic peptide chain release factor subunit 1-like [Penaeus indicus]|uniref:eukaryotic peptide chain release factor subunit 1-like n=1 Tax=Penaeus indicus TaxID=29960 RepID=UPI00300D98C4
MVLTLVETTRSAKAALIPRQHCSLAKPKQAISELAKPKQAISELAKPKQAISELAKPKQAISELAKPKQAISELAKPKQLSREKLVLGLERPSKGLKKKLGESFEAAMILGVADELLRCRPGAKADLSPRRKIRAQGVHAQKVEYCEDATYGFVVIQGDHYTLAVGTLASFEVKFGVANRLGRGGQSQIRFARLAEESRLNHLKGVYERMERAFLAQDKTLLVKRIAVAGPGPMKSQFLEQLPRMWSSLVDPQVLTTAQVGLSRLNQLVALLKE